MHAVCTVCREFQGHQHTNLIRYPLVSLSLCYYYIQEGEERSLTARQPPLCCNNISISSLLCPDRLLSSLSCPRSVNALRHSFLLSLCLCMVGITLRVQPVRGRGCFFQGSGSIFRMSSNRRRCCLPSVQGMRIRITRTYYLSASFCSSRARRALLDGIA